MSRLYSPIRAPRGNTRTAKGWIQEAAKRMLMNNLDPEVAEKPEELIVYGGRGKAARNWECYHTIVETLERLGNEQTLLVQSGKAVGVLNTHRLAPRVLIANSNLVPHWATWEEFDKLDAAGLMMYGQMTAGSWIYIGTQGILQGTYETFRGAAKKYFNDTLAGTITVTAGLGGMGGAQPLAIKLAGGVSICVEVDPKRIQRRLETRYLDTATNSLDEAIQLAQSAKTQRKARLDRPDGQRSGVAARDGEARVSSLTWLPIRPVPTIPCGDISPSHVPTKISTRCAHCSRRPIPSAYKLRSRSMCRRFSRCSAAALSPSTMATICAPRQSSPVSPMLFRIPASFPAFIRDSFCEGRGPFRWVALSGDPADIAKTDQAMLNLFPEDKRLQEWLTFAGKEIAFQGLPARICWLGYRERDRAGLLFNQMVRDGQLSAPIVIGRDHLDAGSVASPFRETEGMLDGSDAVSDWALLNFATGIASGAAWMSFHHGGGVGMGYSQHAGLVAVADGSDEAEQRLQMCLTNDPAMGVIRHADAGYELARTTAENRGLDMPSIK